VTDARTLADRLAAYTEDLLAERLPDLTALLAGLTGAEQAELLEALAAVRTLKAAHQEGPPPTAAFLRQLDQQVEAEIARLAADGAQAATAPNTGVDQPQVIVARPPWRRLVAAGQRALAALRPSAPGGSLRLATAVLLVLVVGLQVQFVRQVRQLETRNQFLAARLEALGPTRLSPLSLPRVTAPPPAPPGTAPREDPGLEALLAGLDLRRQIERRIQELEQALPAQTGADRRQTETLLRELTALLRR
jgi:hypothetical protein